MVNRDFSAILPPTYPQGHDFPMAKEVSIQIEESLEERARAIASRRGISFDQLVAQQLERAVSNDEYANLRRQVSRGARSNSNPSEQLLRKSLLKR